MDSNAFFPDGPMESRRRIQRLYVALAVSLGCMLAAFAGVELITSRPDARPFVQQLMSVTMPMAALPVLLSLTLSRLTGERRSAGQSVSLAMFGLLVTGSILWSTVPEAGRLLLVLFGVAYSFATGSGAGAVWIGIGFVLSTAAVLTVVQGVDTGLFVVAAGAGVLVVSLVVGKVMVEAASTFRLLGQARSAASALSGVILRVEQTVHRARIHEMTRERRRVAREIHDSVGYTLTGLIVQLGVVSRLVTSPEAISRLESLESIARKALQEVREEVGNLRADVDENVVPFLNRWIQVCEYFAECTGIRVDHRFGRGLEHVPVSIGETVYRVIQEGLTNAYRHGEATIVDVSMTWKKERGLVLLRISDNGRGLDKLRPGNGLNGIRERVASVSGSLVIQTEPGRGFDLGIDVPWNGPSAQAVGE